MIKKKLIVAFCSSLFITVIVSVLASSPKSLILSNIPWLYMFIGPTVLVYGTLASLLATYLAKRSRYPRTLYFVYHILLASVFIFFNVSFTLLSIASSVIFYAIDLAYDWLKKYCIF